MNSTKKITLLSSYSDSATRYPDLKLECVKENDTLSSLSNTQYNEKVEGFNRIKRDSAAKANGSHHSAEKSDFTLNSHKEIKDAKKSLSASSSVKSYSEKGKPPEGIYALSSWVRNRPFLSWGFVSEPIPGFTKSGPIGALPPNVQESRLIDDILFCLVGIDGDYVQSNKMIDSASGKMEFHLDESANDSLKQLVQNLFPMFTCYSTITNAVEESLHYERGVVQQALGAALRPFLQDHLVLVSQLELQHRQRRLTLQKLWFYLQPALAAFETLAGVLRELDKGNCFGGNVLSVLHQHTASLTGSSKSAEICHCLTRAASAPYFEMLEKWIYKGIISDYYSEFLVQDNKLLETSAQLLSEYTNKYWEERYTLRQDQVPVFLKKAADMILRTGKYLNVVRQCSESCKSVNFPDAKSLVYSMRESQYVEFIEPAYHFASHKLLDLLIDDLDLKGRLMSVKHYFLLDQGDFVVQWMDLAERELRKDCDSIVPSSLETLLELAVRSSSVGEDRYKDELSLQLMPYNSIAHLFRILKIPCGGKYEESKPLTGLAAFVFKYKVKWPLSLVINGKAFAYYQILFRHLFYCKHIENLLGRVWHMNKWTKSLARSDMSHFVCAFALRQRMLNFVQNLNYYLTLEVIEPHWNEFFKKISQVANVDELLFCHSDFLEKCMVDCMLQNQAYIIVLENILTLCEEFSELLQDMMKFSVKESSMLGDSMLVSTEVSFPELSICPAFLTYAQRLPYLERMFNDGIVKMLGILHTISNQTRQTSKIVNMLYRLDFNNFYEEMRLDGKLESGIESSS